MSDIPVRIGFDLASGPDESVLVCAACNTPLKPDHKSGQRCPGCDIPVFFVARLNTEKGD
jgi:hypothetical protein